MIELMVQAEQALDLGPVDQADRLYQQVVAADPRNAIAIVGLARVRLERGDQAGAHDLALQALAIDPENSAATRMEARLREVLAGQGKIVQGPNVQAQSAQGPNVQDRSGAPPDHEATARPGFVARLLGRAR